MIRIREPATEAIRCRLRDDYLPSFCNILEVIIIKHDVVAAITLISFQAFEDLTTATIASEFLMNLAIATHNKGGGIRCQVHGCSKPM